LPSPSPSPAASSFNAQGQQGLALPSVLQNLFRPAATGTVDPAAPAASTPAPAPATPLTGPLGLPLPLPLQPIQG
jgi:hypothetical protein